MPKKFWLILLFLLSTGCQGSPDPISAEAKGVPTMKLTSAAFEPEGTIPKQYTGEGKDVSPPLSWSGAPANVKSFALICDDPDAPRKEWVHWVLFNLPADTNQLAEGASGTTALPHGAREGSNDFRKRGYGGPMPPPGKPHRYYFKLYALDTMLDLAEGASKQQLEAAMKGHLLAHGELMGKYAR